MNEQEQMTLPWVLIAAGFETQGGTDKANNALAKYLAARGAPVHLVCHWFDKELLEHPRVTVRRVPCPAGSVTLGEWLLERAGWEVAQQVTNRWLGARVLVNGGNCRWADINWVHYVHHAWEDEGQETPAAVHLKNRLFSSLAKWREKQALRMARLVLANSELTRRDLINCLGVKPELIHTIYLGTNPAWGQVKHGERLAAREWLGVRGQTPLVVFVGGLGYDERKGFDVLWTVWRRLCARPDWDAQLIVAGGGPALHKWRDKTVQAGLAQSINFLGFTERVPELLAAADLLVSPVRYESFGLNVQEAICRGVPALVTACAGAAELYPPNLAEMILPRAEDVGDLAARLLRWRTDMEGWKERFRPLAARLRDYTWDDMARRIIGVAEQNQLAGAAPLLRRAANNE